MPGCMCGERGRLAASKTRGRFRHHLEEESKSIIITKEGRKNEGVHTLNTSLGGALATVDTITAPPCSPSPTSSTYTEMPLMCSTEAQARLLQRGRATTA